MNDLFRKMPVLVLPINYTPRGVKAIPCLKESGTPVFLLLRGQLGLVNIVQGVQEERAGRNTTRGPHLIQVEKRSTEDECVVANGRR